MSDETEVERLRRENRLLQESNETLREDVEYYKDSCHYLEEIVLRVREALRG